MSKPDESELKRDYCAGLLSIQKVADKHSIKKSTLIDLAKNRQWVRVKTPTKNADQNANGRTVGRMVGRDNASPKNSEKKSPKKSQKISAEEIEENTFDPDEYGLSEQQTIFAENVAAGKSLTEAYRLAGYQCGDNSLAAAASRLLRNVKVSRAIRFLRDRRQKRLNLAEEEIIHQLSSIASADPNELSQLRRVNCRYCWGDDHLYQYRDDDEYQRAITKSLKDGKPEPDYGGAGFVDSSIPNEDCPRCGGEGTMQLFFADTTQLDGPGRWLFAGVKETMNGIEIKTASQDAARRELLKLAQANRSRIPAGASPDQQGKEELELERLRLGNEKLQVEIENIKNGKQESNLVVVHNALQIPGAVQPTQTTDEGD